MSDGVTPPNAERFSPLGGAYARFRPSYPRELLDWLAAELGLTPGRIVADIGAGTGLFTRPLLERGLRVLAVEPSAAMLAEAQTRLSAYSGFTAVAGTAERTGLPAESVDAICCAQAFHWFNHVAVLEEWRRILRPGGTIALVWNNIRRGDAFGFRLVELMRRHSTDAGRTIDQALEVQAHNVIFGTAAPRRATFANPQAVSYAGLVGRTESVSYVPKVGAPGYAPMMEELRILFVEYERAGQVILPYESLVLTGPLPDAGGSVRDAGGGD